MVIVQVPHRAFAALGDPTRAAIVDRLSRGSATVSDLAVPFSMSLRGVLKHIKVLEEAGIVRTSKTGRERWCVLRWDGLTDVIGFVERVTSQH